MPGIVRQGDFHAGHAQPAPPYYHTGSFISRNPNVLVNSRPIVVTGDFSTCSAQAKAPLNPARTLPGGIVVAGETVPLTIANALSAQSHVHAMFDPVSTHGGGPVEGLHETVTPVGSLNVLVGSTLTGVVGALFKLPFPAGINGGITSPVLGDTAPKASGLPSANDILDANKAEIQAGGSAAMNDMLEYGEGALTVLVLVAADSLLGASPLFDNKPHRRYGAVPSAGSGAKFNVIIYAVGRQQFFQVFREDDSIIDELVKGELRRHTAGNAAIRNENKFAEEGDEKKDELPEFDAKAKRNENSFWNLGEHIGIGTEPKPAMPIRSGSGYAKGDVLFVGHRSFFQPEEAESNVLVIEVLEVEATGPKLDGFTLKRDGTGADSKYSLTGHHLAANKTLGDYYEIGSIVSVSAMLDVVVVTTSKETETTTTGQGAERQTETKTVSKRRSSTHGHPTGNLYFRIAGSEDVSDDGGNRREYEFEEAFFEPFRYPLASNQELGSISISLQPNPPAEGTAGGRIFSIDWEGNPFAPGKHRSLDPPELLHAGPGIKPEFGATYRINELETRHDEALRRDVPASDAADWHKIGVPDNVAEPYADLVFDAPKKDPANPNLVLPDFDADTFGSGTVLEKVVSAAAVQRETTATGQTDGLDAAGFEKIDAKFNDRLEGIETEMGTDNWFRPVFAYRGVKPIDIDSSIPAGLAPAPQISGIVHAPGVDARYTTEFADLLRRIATNYGRPMTVISAFRHETFNKAAAGAPDSFHTKGLAADIALATKTRARNQADYESFVRACIDAGVGGIGIQIAKGFIHIDAGPKRAWGIDGSRRSVPDWAARPLKDAGYI